MLFDFYFNIYSITTREIDRKYRWQNKFKNNIYNK